MKDKDTIEQVLEFSETFGAYVGNEPQVPPKQVLELRFKLMFEELMEWVEACGIRLQAYMVMTDKLDEWVVGSLSMKEPEPNLVEALDALADMRYVNDGTILAMGLHGVFSDGFNEVHASNMSKVCTSEEEAQATVDKYAKENVATYIAKAGEKWVVLRKSDSKVLKSIKYWKPDLSKYVQNPEIVGVTTLKRPTMEYIQSLKKNKDEKEVE